MTTKPDNSGLLVIDKPQGVTSHDVVAVVRGALHMKRVGHAGTLDPMATGVLVVGFGNATRLLNYIVDHDKTYLATIRLGQRTTTDDADGELLPEDRTIANSLHDRPLKTSSPIISPGASSRCRTPIQPSKSTASAPMIWPEKARMWTSSPIR